MAEAEFPNPSGAESNWHANNQPFKQPPSPNANRIPVPTTLNHKEIGRYLADLKAENQANPERSNRDKQNYDHGLKAARQTLAEVTRQDSPFDRGVAKRVEDNRRLLERSDLADQIRRSLEAQNQFLEDLADDLGFGDVIRHDQEQHHQHQRVAETRRKLEQIYQSQPQQPGFEHQQQPERLDPNWLAELVLESTKGHTVINTKPGYDEEVKFGRDNSKRIHHTGFLTFGDGLINEYGALPWYLTDLLHDKNARSAEGALIPTDAVEIFGFQPATEQDRTIINPHTGKEEAAEYFDYRYSHSQVDPRTRKELGLPRYPEPVGVRDGNMLLVRTLLPKSLAAELRQKIQHDANKKPPDFEYARNVIEQVVLTNGISPEGWNSGRSINGIKMNPVKPPYEGLPPEHRPYILDAPSQPGPSWRFEKLGQAA